MSQVPVIPDKRIQEIDFGVLEGARFRDEKGRVVNKQMEVFLRHPFSMSGRKTERIF